LYYFFAIPVGWAADLFLYKLKGKPLPAQKTRMKFENNRPAEDNTLTKIWYPATNTRFLAVSFSIYSLIYYLLILLILLVFFLF
jgi:hypothetical protein